MDIKQASDLLGLEYSLMPWFVGVTADSCIITVCATDVKEAKAALPGSWDGFLIRVHQSQKPVAQVKAEDDELHERDFEIPSDNG